MNINFKNYLLTENENYLAQRIGDILNALQDLQENHQNMGTRQTVAAAKTIVSQIRSILHVNWAKKQLPTLESLQKVGVAIMKTVEERGNIADILPACIAELQKNIQKTGEPINNL